LHYSSPRHRLITPCFRRLSSSLLLPRTCPGAPRLHVILPRQPRLPPRECRSAGMVRGDPGRQEQAVRGALARELARLDARRGRLRPRPLGGLRQSRQQVHCTPVVILTSQQLSCIVCRDGVFCVVVVAACCSWCQELCCDDGYARCVCRVPPLATTMAEAGSRG